MAKRKNGVSNKQPHRCNDKFSSKCNEGFLSFLSCNSFTLLALVSNRIAIVQFEDFVSTSFLRREEKKKGKKIESSEWKKTLALVFHFFFFFSVSVKREFFWRFYAFFLPFFSSIPLCIKKKKVTLSRIRSKEPIFVEITNIKARDKIVWLLITRRFRRFFMFYFTF